MYGKRVADLWESVYQIYGKACSRCMESV